MSKRLIMILALALFVGIAFAAYAEVQNVKVSGDLTVLGIFRQLSPTSQRAENTMASITRVRVDADLTDKVMATVRLINERYWGKDTNGSTSDADHEGVAGTSGDNTNIDIDLAYATLKEFLYSPLTLTIGRQELHFGNDMIIGDAFTNNHASNASVFGQTIDPDLSMRKSFDAIRATLNYDPLVVDVVAAQIRKNARTQPNGSHLSLTSDDQETLMGVNANYAVSKVTDVEGYFWSKRVGRKEIEVGTAEESEPGQKISTINTVGGRVVTRAIKNLTYQLEAAYQFGNAENPNDTEIMQKPRAWAAETALTYDMKDIKNVGKYKPTATLLYAFFSGGRTDWGREKKTYGGWDPMYENQKFGDIANDLFNQTNAHILGGILTMKPVDDIALKGEYYAYWWDKRFSNITNWGLWGVSNATGEFTAMTNKKFAGQEVDLSATYDYTEDVQFSLLGGLLFPGNSFDKTQNHNTAGELIGSMKVTF